MAASKVRPLGQDDLDRAIRSVATHFETDTVYVIGSQALLVSQTGLDSRLRMSVEIDCYPGNAPEWEAQHVGFEASEEIAALFGEGSFFHQGHNFFIDGVDETTAILPPDWQDRAVTRTIDDHAGGTVTAVAPSPVDVVAAKLARGADRDLIFAARCIGSGLVTNRAVKQSLEQSLDGEALAQALALVDRASRAKNNPASAPAGFTNAQLLAFLGDLGKVKDEGG
ncbi:hypothetical protein K3M67_14005 [Sphingobium sp. V4]|uniref:DUF6036 family nucleotidyltransferase n=1 Tax=Sphingobium sp. V4 TaxID=3038927 RepID=UPI002557F5BE|nr:DUF6036 family nucleotidyltransferase [Sphingobium sp. V4]WIW88057.1 hypothetical protein K3M67_14005 [Sphingobium sp. V4]